MAVIALTVSGDEPSIVTSKDAFSREGCAILILDGDLQQLEACANDCNATYDLRVGHTYRDHRSQGGQEVGLTDSIRLRPGNAVIIQTEETVAFPKWRFGQILPKVSLLQEGVANTPSKVDPGYEGHLLITTFNHGRRTVFLRRGQRFCSLHVFEVAGPVQPYSKAGKEMLGARQPARWQKFRDWVDANGARWAFIQTPALVVTAIIAILSLFLHR